MRSLILTSLALTACNGTTVVVGDLQEITSMKTIPNPNLDILFVIDNSGSMAEEQDSLAQNFPLMMDVLAQLDGGLPNLHIGVVTSDMGTSASGSPSPGPGIGVIGQGGCTGYGDNGVLHGSSFEVTDAFISDVSDGSGGRIRNYTGALRDVFAANARVGNTGCGFEQHLSAMRRALVSPANAGFLRADANLAVVIIADEDDCSALDIGLLGADTSTMGPLHSFRCARFGVACDPDDWTTIGNKADCVPRASSMFVEDVQPFVNALLAAKPDPRSVMVAGIVGDPTSVAMQLTELNGTPQPALTPSCVYAGPNGPQSADPAVRLSAFLDAFPGRSSLTSICSADLTAPLVEIGDSAKKLIGDPCLDSTRLADSSPDPGLQPACEVVDIRDSAPTAPTVLADCASGASDCFEIVRDAAACPAVVENLRVRFRRTSVVSDDTWTHVRCQLEQ